MSADRDWEELKAEAGAGWARAIARAAVKIIRQLKAQPGAGGKGAVTISTSRQAVTDVRRSVEERESGDPLTPAKR